MINRKILVTGGAGFIGSHTVVELLNNGFQVIVADDLSNSHEDVIHAIELITGTKPVFVKINLCNREETERIFKEHNPGAIIHFAAKKLVGESVENPLLYYYNNLVSLMNVAESAVNNNCFNMVFSSSCTVYGQPDSLPVNENSPLKEAESPYGNTKKISEAILRDVVRSSGMKVISLRYFNPVGAHHSALIGEYPLGAPSNLMPVLTQTAIGKRKSFSIFGDDYNTPDGTCIRDYIHVEDLAVAHNVAIERILGNKIENPFETFNIGTGTGVSVMEMVKCFEQVNKLKLDYIVTSRRPGDVEQVWADTSKANKVMGWKASKTLDEMVSSAWAWEKHLFELEQLYQVKTKE